MTHHTGPPPEKEDRARHQHVGDPATTVAANDTARQVRGAGAARFDGSQAVSWWSVHEYVSPLLISVGTWPMVGTPEWCALPDDHPRKLAAIYDAARHWALRLETRQQALAEASGAIATAADWSAIATEMVQRHGAYIPRRAAS